MKYFYCVYIFQRVPEIYHMRPGVKISIFGITFVLEVFQFLELIFLAERCLSSLEKRCSQFLQYVFLSGFVCHLERPGFTIYFLRPNAGEELNLTWEYLCVYLLVPPGLLLTVYSVNILNFFHDIMVPLLDQLGVLVIDNGQFLKVIFVCLP